jgi:hypothetical protein
MRGQPGCYVVDHRDVEGALKALEGGLVGATYARDTKDLSRATRTRRLAEILDRAVGSPTS